MIKKILFTLFVVFAFTEIAFAQFATTNSKFEWEMNTSDLDTANAYRYEVEINGSWQTTPLVVTCVGIESPFTCESVIPALTPNRHGLRVRAVDVSVPTQFVYSDPSNMLDVTMRVVPNNPFNFRLKTNGQN